MRRALLVLLAGLAATGCLLPDRSRLDAAPRDAGPDAPIPEDAGDGGDAGDAGDGGGCQSEELFERTCEGGEDEDCDGLVDCNDFDCGRELACCGSGGERIVSEFESATFDWISLPTGLAPAIEPELSDDVIRNFYTGEPRALRYSECLPVDLGVEISATLRAPTAGPCEAGEACPYAAIVLTPTREMARGVPLPDELSVRLYGDRRLEVRRAGARLEARPGMLGIGDVDVTIQLTPGLDDEGRAWVYAAISVAQSGVPTWRAFDAEGGRRALIPREDLVGAALGCDETRGLFLALEGIGARVEIDSIATDPFECANPSNFSALRGGGVELGRAELGADPGWASGGVGAPALGSYFLGASDAWDLYYDATNVPRTNELVAPVRYAIGVSSTGDDEGITGWAARGGGPVVGVDPPQCSGAGCPELSSAREPSLYVPLDEDTRRVPTGRFGWLAYARELPGSEGRRFGLEMTQVTFSPFAVSTSPFELLTPESEGGGCDSLRDPLLLPMEPAPADDFWLLYGCEQGGRLREIRAARVSTEGDVSAVPLETTVLDHTQLGSIASISLRGADGAAWFPEGSDDYVYRLWVVTRDIAARTSVAFAEAAGKRGELPRFEPYAANPVLRGTDAVLGSCSGARCDIDSIAVTRIANAPQRVRLMVGRTITSSTEVRHVLVPLDQVWPR